MGTTFWGSSSGSSGSGTGLVSSGVLPDNVLVEGLYVAEGTNLVSMLYASSSVQSRVQVSSTLSGVGTVISVPIGESLNGILNGTYTINEDMETLLFSDNEVGKWTYEVLGIGTFKVSTITEMLAISNPKTNDIVDLTDSKRGDRFKYDTAKSLANDGVLIFNGWVRQSVTQINALWGGIDDLGLTDDTLLWEKIEAASEGKTLFIPKGEYLKGRTFPKKGTTIIMEEGTNITNIDNGSSIWRINQPNITIYANNATLIGKTNQISHTFYLDGAVNFKSYNLNILGTGISKDCIYFGNNSYKCKMKGGSANDVQRLGIGIVSIKKLVLDDVEVSGSLSHGINIEANNYDECESILIKHCDVHDNAGIGITPQFVEKVRLYKNDVYKNGINGIACETGATQFDHSDWSGLTDIARPQDRRGVGAFDLDGWISVFDGSSIPKGTVIQFNTKNGATLPSELTSNIRWVVSAHHLTDPTRVRIGISHDYFLQTSFSNAGTGTLSNILANTDISIISFERGQCSDIVIKENTLYENTSNDIRSGRCVDVKILSNNVTTTTLTGILSAYTNTIDIIGNSIFGKGSNVNVTGLGCSAGSFYNIARNKVYDFNGYGLGVGTTSYANIISNLSKNCGIGRAKAMEFSGLTSSNVHGNITMHSGNPAIIDLYFPTVDTLGRARNNNIKDNKMLIKGWLVAHEENTKLDNLKPNGTLDPTPLVLTNNVGVYLQASGIIRDGVDVVATNNLSIDVTSGTLSYYNSGTENVDTSTILAGNPILFRYLKSDGTEETGLDSSVLDFTQYYASNVLTTLPINNNVSVQKLYLNTEGTYVVHRGSVLYADLGDAVANYGSESVPDVVDSILISVFLGQKDTLTLDSTRVEIGRVTKFGEVL